MEAWVNNITTLTRKQRGLKVRDVWYDTRRYKDADVVYYMQMTEPFGDEWYEQYTVLIDLSKGEEELWKKISKSCKTTLNNAGAREALR